MNNQRQLATAWTLYTGEFNDSLAPNGAQQPGASTAKLWVMGGYHIQADNIAGLDLGRKVAGYDWPRVRAYFNGTATPR